MATVTYHGSTENADAPFLNASFWEVGKKIMGKVVKVFETQNEKNGVIKKEPAYTLSLGKWDDPKEKKIFIEDATVEVDGEEWERVSVGAMSGIKMANSDAREVDPVTGEVKPSGRKLPGERWLLNDVITITCKGFKAAKKEGYSPRVNFGIDITREVGR